MRKINTILICMSALLSLPACSQSPQKEQQDAIFKEYIHRAEKDIAEKHEWINFDVHREYFTNDTMNWDLTCNVTLRYDKKDPIIYVNWDNDFSHYAFRMTKDKFEMIDFSDKDITLLKNFHIFTDKYHSFGKDYVYKCFEYLGYYLTPIQNKIRTLFCLTTLGVSEHENVILNGESYSKYVSHGTSGGRNRQFIRSNGTEVELIENTVLYVNNSTGLLDSVYTTSFYEDEPDVIYKSTFKIDNFHFDNKQSHLDLIFDLDNPKYADFKRYKNEMPNMAPSEYKDIDSMMDFPIISLNQDTTTIREHDGWILLQIWSFSCSPCIKKLAQFQQEKDSLGYRILEKNGVEIVAVNTTSDNWEVMNKVADALGCGDIIYSAKGFSKTPDVYGELYLISPEKEIVFKPTNLDSENYDKILEIINNYKK